MVAKSVRSSLRHMCANFAAQIPQNLRQITQRLAS